MLCSQVGPRGRRASAAARSEAGRAYTEYETLGSSASRSSPAPGPPSSAVGSGAKGSGGSGVDHDTASPAHHSDAAGADELQDAVGPQHFDETVNLVFGTGGLDDDGIGRDVDDTGTEDVGELQHVRARVGRCGHLDHRQLAEHGGAGGDVPHAHDVDQLVEVGLEPPGADGVRADDDGHPGGLRRLGVAHGERLDVERAAPEQ